MKNLRRKIVLSFLIKIILDDLWGNFQIILDEIFNSKSRINLLDKSGTLISNHTNNDFLKILKKI